MDTRSIVNIVGVTTFHLLFLSYYHTAGEYITSFNDLVGVVLICRLGAQLPQRSYNGGYTLLVYSGRCQNGCGIEFLSDSPSIMPHECGLAELLFTSETWRIPYD